MNALKYNFGFVVVVIAAGITTALVTGSSIFACLGAILIALLFLVLVLRRPAPGRSQDQSGSTTSTVGSPIAFTVRVPRGEVKVPEVVQQLEGLGLKRSGDSNGGGTVTLRGGSQFTTRLLGGYFVDPMRLPMEVHLAGSAAPPGGLGDLIISMADRLGSVALRDPRLIDRYKLAAEKVRAAVDGTEIS